MKVWEIFRSGCSTGSPGLYSEGLFATEERAVAEVPIHIKWIEDYHGPFYPVTWKPAKLASEGPREWETMMGEKIRIEEREVAE